MFIKHQSDQGRIAEVLAIPTLMNLDLYLEMRMISVCFFAFSELRSCSVFVLIYVISGLHRSLGRRYQAVHVALVCKSSFKRHDSYSVLHGGNESIKFQQHQDPGARGRAVNSTA